MSERILFYDREAVAKATASTYRQMVERFLNDDPSFFENLVMKWLSKHCKAETYLRIKQMLEMDNA